MLTVRNLAHIQSENPKLAEALQDIINGINAQSSPTVTPPQVSSLSVTSSGGIFDIAIQDNNPVQRGIVYFAEYSLSPSFVQPHVIELGAPRTWRGYLGNQTLYWRAYSQYYPLSPPSSPVYFGSETNPTAVVGGGSSGPTPQASTGSGTAPSNGLTGGAGYGYTSARGNPVQAKQKLPL